MLRDEKKKKKDLVSLVKKSSILLLKSVLEPQWISNLKLNSPYYNCMESLIEEITRITATNVKQFVFTVNLDSYLHLVDQKLILKNINSSIYLKRKCQEILKNNFFESYQHIKINYYMTDKKLPELQFGNLLVDILFHEFKSLFGRYIQKYILIHKQIPINKKQYSLRYLCNFIFIDSDYGYLKNIRYLFVNWIKKIGISLKSNETKIKSIDRWFHILQFSLIQVQKNNQRRIKIKPSSKSVFFFFMIRRPPGSTLFPYPTLFRSNPNRRTRSKLCCPARQRAPRKAWVCLVSVSKSTLRRWRAC